MIDPSLLFIFIPTFIMVSITPGMCMTLALTMGMSVGFRKTLWMMAGELAGVALVTVSAALGVATLIIEHPYIFTILKTVGGAYLIYSGFLLWYSKGRFSLSNVPFREKKPIMYTIQGFLTAVGNPKGWAFIISLLPPFINPDLAVAPQLTVLVSIILLTEFLSMVLYAKGGSTLKKILQQKGKVELLNRISGSVMILIGILLALS